MSNIYLLDDHPMVREGLCGLLEAAGHRVVGQASDPAQAVEDIARLHPDVLLLDLTLSNASGLVVLIELQQQGLSQTRTIMLTMSAQARHVRESLRSGAQGYVLKGSTAQELLDAIEVVMHGGRYLSPQVAAFDPLVDTSLTDACHPHDARDPWGLLSMRERQILEMVVRGQSSAAIALSVHLSPKTIETYRSRIMAKLQVRNLTELVRYAVRHGLLDAEDA